MLLVSRGRCVASAGVLLGLMLAACGSPPPAVTTPSRSPGGVFDVTSYGAQGDGLTDSTMAFSQAVAAAQSAGGGTVYVPAGKYAFTLARTPSPASMVIEGTTPITLKGAGRDQTSLIELHHGKGLLSVRVDGTVVEDITLDTQTYDGGAAIFVQANHTSLLRSRVLGGTKHFALYYAGPKGAKPLSPAYNVGNTVNDIDVNDLVCDDGFSWSFQKDSSISNVTHTGSRLALYVDVTTTVTDYKYAPGNQQCGARNGFWITPPADSITIVNFTSSGEGGMVGVIGPKGVGKLATNVTIRGLTMTATGLQLTIGDVRNLLLENCNLGSNTIVIKAQGTAQGAVSHCTYGQLISSSSPTAQVAITTS